MLTSIINMTFVLAAVVSSMPAPAPAPAQRLHKRDECTMTGEYSATTVVGGGGPGQAPVFEYSSSLFINYVGGVNIKGQVADGNSLGSETYQTADTNLPQPITWSTPNNGLPNEWTSCVVVYEGVTYTGVPDESSDSPGNDSITCSVNFPCEGSLPSS